MENDDDVYIKLKKPKSYSLIIKKDEETPDEFIFSLLSSVFEFDDNKCGDILTELNRYNKVLLLTTTYDIACTLHAECMFIADIEEYSNFNMEMIDC